MFWYGILANYGICGVARDATQTWYVTAVDMVVKQGHHM